MSRDWHAWYERYDDPSSSLVRRLRTVRRLVGELLDDGVSAGPPRVLSLCAGDGRDLLPVLADGRRDVRARLVELDPDLAARARSAAADLDLGSVEVVTGDAGTTDAGSGIAPVDLLMVCGVLGNVTDADTRRTVETVPSLLRPGGVVVWTRDARVDLDPTRLDGDPAEALRDRLLSTGFAEVAYVRPDDASFRVGAHRWAGPAVPFEPGRTMFSFV